MTDFKNYELPSGEIVRCDNTATKDARWITFTKAGGEIVPAVEVPVGGEGLPGDSFIVICLEQGGYVLATRQVFPTRDEAQRYATTCSPSRRPIVVPGRFFELRPPYGKEE